MTTKIENALAESEKQMKILHTKTGQGEFEPWADEQAKNVSSPDHESALEYKRLKSIVALMEAAMPMAELLEYPEEQKVGRPMQLEVYPEDVTDLKAAIANLYW